jgi:hypothetical protein
MRGFRMPSTGRIVMGLLAVIVSGLALSAAPTVVKATAADPYCYVSGYLGVDGWVDQGQDFAYVTGEVQVGTSVPGGYDMTWYHGSCNLEAARIQVWLPDSYMDCLIGRQSGSGCENDSPSVPNAYTMVDGEAYNQGGFYGLYTAYGQTYYWTNNLQALNYSLSLQKNALPRVLHADPDSHDQQPAVRLDRCGHGCAVRSQWRWGEGADRVDGRR